MSTVFNKWSQKERETHLSAVGCLPGNFEGGLHAVCQEITLDVEVFCTIDKACDLRSGQVGLFELLCGAQSGDERPGARSARAGGHAHLTVTLPVMTSDNDCTRSRLLALLDEISFCETLSFVRRPELLGKLVIADAASVHYGIGGQHILRCIRRRGGVKKKGLTAAPRAAFCAAPPAT